MIPSIGRVKRYWRRGAGVGRVGTKRLLDRWVYNSSHKRLVRKVDNGLDDLSNSPYEFFDCGYPELVHTVSKYCECESTRICFPLMHVDLFSSGNMCICLL